MAKFTNPLNNIKVASPCSANWDEMVGNDRQRFCGQCELNVFNLSAMTKTEAKNLIMNAEGRLCARFYKRADGTIITKDCPVGWKAVKRRMSKAWTAVASIVITAFSGIGIVSLFNPESQDADVIMGKMIIEKPHTSSPPKANPPENLSVVEMGEIAPVKEDKPRVLMGKIAVDKN